MERYFEAQFIALRDQLLRMSYLSIESLQRALDGLYGRDRELCQKVVEDDKQIDLFEIENDKACIELLLLRQPVARDLRFATMSMKINSSLERVGDQAVYIARVGCDLADLPPVTDFLKLPELGDRAKTALQRAMDSYIREDAELAREVRNGDVEINRLHRYLIQHFLEFMVETPARVAQAVELIFLAKSLERCADYAKNIADDVIYLVEAVDPRHQGEDPNETE